MSRKIDDLWDSCYSAEHQKQVPADEFRGLFCKECMNVGCRNSKANSTSWAKRILEQEEKLLRNPVFADPKDPRFQKMSEMDFKAILEEAISIKISDERGDWSLPTTQEIGREAAAMVGLAPPISWKKEEKPLETQTPAPAETWKVVGDSGKIWEVSLLGETWSCTCPVNAHKKQACKHIEDIKRRIQKAPPKQQTPELTMPPPGVAPIFKPSSGLNTKVPAEGIHIGKIPDTTEVDPWALPPTAPPINERVIPPGGRVQFKK